WPSTGANSTDHQINAAPWPAMQVTQPRQRKMSSGALRSAPAERFHGDFALAFANLRKIVTKLHPHQVFHLGSERPLNPEGHFSGQRCILIEQVRQGRSSNIEPLGRLSHC